MITSPMLTHKRERSTLILMIKFDTPAIYRRYIKVRQEQVMIDCHRIGLKNSLMNVREFY